MTIEAGEDSQFADLVDDLFSQLLDGQSPDLVATAARHPSLAHRVAEAAALASGVAGRRVTPRPSLQGYEVVRELGRGGMGTVYLATQADLDRRVALKVLPHSYGFSPRSRQRFLQEARALARVHHPNIVGIHRIIDDGEVLAFEMEFVEGPSLQQVLQHLRGQRDATGTSPSLPLVADMLGLPMADLGARNLTQFFVRLASRVAGALGVVHKAGLIHRDVKPSNILLRRNGEPVLVDFGLVRPADNDLSRSGGFAGTPVYSAPEQLRGDATIGPPADVYGLAVTLYECLTLTTPFPGHTTTELLKRIEAGRFQPLRRLHPDAPRDLETIVAYAMGIEPTQRYADGGAFADDLQRLQDLQPIRARPAGIVRRLGKLLRRQRTPLLAGVIGAALVVTALLPVMQQVEARGRRREVALDHVRVAQQYLVEGGSLRAGGRPRIAPSPTDAAQPVEDTTIQPLLSAVAEYELAATIDSDCEAAQAEGDVARIALWLRRLVVPQRQELASALENEEFRTLTAHMGPFTVRGVRSLAMGTTGNEEPFEDLADAEPEDRATLGLLGFLLHDFRLCERAWQDLPPHLRDRPLVDAALGIIHNADGMPDLAYVRLLQARRHFTDSTTLARELAEVSVTLGDATLARQWLPLLGDDPASANLKRRLELDLRAATASEEELTAGFRELARLDPNDPTPRHRLARLALRRGDLAAAATGFDALITTWPTAASFRLDRARLALQQRDLPAYGRQALAVLEQDYGRRLSRGATAELLEVLRLGGLVDLYREGLATTQIDRTGRMPLGGELPIRGFVRGELAASFEGLLPLLDQVRREARRVREDFPRLEGPLSDAFVTLPLFAARLPTWPRIEHLPARLLLAATPRIAEWAYPFCMPPLFDAYLRLTGRRRVPVQPIDPPADLPEVATFGNALLRIDDRTGDGVDEVLVAAASKRPAEEPGRVLLVDGAKGTILDEFLCDSDEHIFGHSLAALGDVDGDGVSDWLIGAPAGAPRTSYGIVEVWSGAKRQCIKRIEGDGPGFGVSLAGLGDVDGDGVPDFAVSTAPLLRNTAAQGLVQVFSGRTHAVLHTLRNDTPGVWFGAAIARAGDADGDGVDDLIVGGNFGRAPGLVRLYSGRTGAPLQTWSDPAAGRGFGTAVSGAGDIDGDGRSDVIITSVNEPEAGPGQVLLFSGATGTLLAAITADSIGTRFGASVAVWSQARGKPLLIIGGPFGGAAATGIIEFWTLTGQRLQSLSGPWTNGHFGSAMALSTDHDGDGRQELFVAGARSRGQGSVFRIPSANIDTGR